MGKLLGALICATFFVCSASAVELSVLDFDGTVFEIKKFDKNTPGIYDTKVILYRIENRPNLIVDMPTDLPREIEVSSLDMKHKLTRINEVTEREESILSPKDGHIGSLSEVTLSDGKKIIPGLYRIESPGSFKYFREGTKVMGLLRKALPLQH